MANILDILTRAQALRQETALNSITPDRAGGIMYDTLLVLNQMQLEGASLLISKVYASVSAMEADTTPTSDLTGRALKPGQLVVIVTSDTSSSDMGSEYRYNGPGSWTYVGKVGGLPLDTVPTQSSTKGITSGGVYAALSAMKAEGYKYMGIATPGSGGTAPGTPNQPVFYIAGPGSYPNFGSITVASGYLGFIKYSSGSWTVESVAVGKDYDAQISALDGQITQLEAKVDSLPRGKDYGFFTSSSLLPSDATEEGFAYVGASEPYAIWQFDGTSWSDSGVTANAFTVNDEQVAEAVDDYLDEHPAVIGTFPNSAKRALVSLLEKVAYIDGNGQAYIDQLHAALNDIAIDHIVATFTQGTAKVYDLDTLEKLRNYLVVTAYFVDGTHGEIFDYELSGTLTYGTSTITVTADEDKTDTFEVTVTGTKKLYYNGDECSTVTGGWQTKGFNLKNGTPSKTKESSDLLIKFASSAQSGGAAGSWSSTNKINLTGYTRLVVEVEAYNASGRGAFWAYWPNTLSEGTTQTAAYGSDYSSNRVTVREMGRASDTSTYPFPSPAETTTIRRTLGTSRTEAYISLNLNLYSDTGVSPTSYYTAGAYVKIKRVFLATD